MRSFLYQHRSVENFAYGQPFIVPSSRLPYCVVDTASALDEENMLSRAKLPYPGSAKLLIRENGSYSFEQWLHFGFLEFSELTWSQSLWKVMIRIRSRRATVKPTFSGTFSGSACFAFRKGYLEIPVSRFSQDRGAWFFPQRASSPLRIFSSCPSLISSATVTAYSFSCSNLVRQTVRKDTIVCEKQETFGIFIEATDG